MHCTSRSVSDADELLTFDRDFARRSPTVDAIKVRLL